MPQLETQPNIQVRVYNLYCELIDAKKNKKSVLKECTEDIKRIEAEIDELIEAEERDTEDAQREAAT